MSGINRIALGVEDNQSVVKWYDTTNANNPQVSMYNESTSSNDGTSHFKIKKRINNNLAEIMRIDDDGKVTFYKNVSFDGGSSLVNAVTTSIQDQQLEIGLFDSKNIASVSRTNDGTTYTYTFTVTTTEFVGDNWTHSDSDVWTTSIEHGLVVGDAIRFTTDGGGADAYSTNTTYYVRTVPSTTTLTLSTTETGSAVDTNASSGDWNAAKITYKSSENGQTPDYVYFQNTKLTNGTDVTQFQASLEVTESTETTFKVVLTGITDADAVDIDNSTYPIVVSKLSTLTNNTGIKILAQDSGTLNEAKLAFNTGNSNSFVIQNNSGTNSEALFLNASSGGITSQFSSDKSYIIKNADNNLKITLTDDSTTLANEKILLENTNGTDNAAIALTSSAGGITATCDDDKSIILQNEANDTYIKLNANNTTASSETIQLVNAHGTDNAAITLTSSAGGITSQFSADKSYIIKNADDDLKITLTDDSGSVGNEKILLENTNGTDNAAITLTSSAGGITSQFSADKSYIIKNADNDLKITLTDDSGSVGNEKILLENTNGTDNAAITLTSSAGGITSQFSADKSYIIKNADNDLKITLTDDSGSVGNEKILLENTNGTDNAAITLTSSAGGITATCDDDKSIILQNEANDTYIKLNANNTTASSETIQLVNAHGTDNAAISLTSSVGGIDINASGLISLDSSGGLINIGNDNNNQNINIGTNGDRTITIGATGGTTSIKLDGSVAVKDEIVSSSDKRLKKNIVKLNGALDKVTQMRGVSFKWRDDKNKGKNKNNKKKKVIGFIAQEVEEIVPDLTGVDSKGFMTVNYLGTTALLVEAIKEQQKIINELKKKVDSLSK